ncbi:hypothetical protein HNP38_001031 [Chryseobacterium defluvii]|uniref:Uncharacterized protein n=1 Tax=Chryseobacterium defluvii TaxID=160396 RepID=A0A840K8X8_9FLAO|nr:hypothetical protein [Chryseobacterium defluvii]MBB4805759.1 hypothetical protein [Chryseobacterium defluvii]
MKKNIPFLLLALLLNSCLNESEKKTDKNSISDSSNNIQNLKNIMTSKPFNKAKLLTTTDLNRVLAIQDSLKSTGITNPIDIDNIILNQVKGNLVEYVAWGAGRTLKGYNVRIEKLEISSFNIVWDNISQREDFTERYFDIYQQANCASTPRQWKETLELKNIANESVIFHKNNYFKSSKEIAFKVDIPATPNHIIQRIVFSTPDEWLTKNSVVTNNSRVVEIEIPAEKKAFVKLQKIIKNNIIPYTVTIQIDGKLLADYKWNDSKGKGSIKNYSSPISKFIPIEKRTFTITGFRKIGKAGNLEVIFDERPVNRTEDCIF